MRQYFSLLFSVLGSSSLTFFLYYLAFSLAEVYAQRDLPSNMLLYLTSFIGAFLFFHFISDMFSQSAASTSMTYFKRQYIEKILSLPYENFKEQHSASLLTFLDESSKKFRVYFSSFFRLKYQIFFVPLYLLFVISYFDFFAAAALFFVLLFIPLIMFILGRYTQKKSEEQISSLMRLSEHFLDVVRGLTILKIFNQGDLFEKKLMNSNEVYRKKTMGILKVAFLNSLALDLFASISTAIIAVTIGFELSLGKIDFKSGLFVLFVLPQFFMVFKQFANNYHISKDAYVLLEKMENIFSEPRCKVGRAAPTDVHSLEFKNLSVSRQEDAFTFFEALNIKISTHSLVGIFGPSGHGKTSFIHAILGQIDYQGGILLNGEKISDLSQIASYMPQFPFFFSGTAAQNINFFTNDFQYEKMNDLILKLDLKETLSKKENQHKLDSNYGGLSGGERKRIAIIRTLLLDKPVYIFDEPTENLDEANVYRLLEVFSEYKKMGKIILFTSHLRDISRSCDKSIHFREGKVVVT